MPFYQDHHPAAASTFPHMDKFELTRRKRILMRIQAGIHTHIDTLIHMGTGRLKSEDLNSQASLTLTHININMSCVHQRLSLLCLKCQKST